MHAGGYAGRLHALFGAVVAVVALDRLMRDRIHIDGPVRTNVDACPVSAADVVIDGDRSTGLFVQCSARAGLDARCVFAVLARHGKKHPRDFGVLADVLVDGLANVVAERHIVFGAARDGCLCPAVAAAAVLISV